MSKLIIPNINYSQASLGTETGWKYLPEPHKVGACITRGNNNSQVILLEASPDTLSLSYLEGKLSNLQNFEAMYSLTATYGLNGIILRNLIAWESALAESTSVHLIPDEALTFNSGILVMDAMRSVCMPVKVDFPAIYQIISTRGNPFHIVSLEKILRAPVTTCTN